jgi:hypothetical protein
LGRISIVVADLILPTILADRLLRAALGAFGYIRASE